MHIQRAKNRKNAKGSDKKVSITNVKADLLWTHHQKYKNFKVIPFSHLTESELKDHESIYENYKKLLDKKTTNILLQNANNNFKPNDSSVVWLNTDIYKTSLKIKEMQNLEFNILSQWIEPTQKLLE